jgi:hypothetical protein
MMNCTEQGLYRGPKNRLACREAFYEALSRLSCGKGKKVEEEKKATKDAHKSA